VQKPTVTRRVWPLLQGEGTAYRRAGCVGQTRRVETDFLGGTAATPFIARVHRKVVQEILAHSQISLTMDTYSTVLPTVSRAAAEQMDAVWRAG
jgi:hypothetical protein